MQDLDIKQPVLPRTAVITPSATASRIVTIDFMRGLIMVIMALDHVRDFIHHEAYLYNPLDETKTSIALYITRWITHLCAPTFIMLAGTSAYLVGKRKPKKQLSLFLLTRGLWLVIAELTIISFSWAFNVHFSLFGVVGAIGVSMMILSLLVFLPDMAILVFGLAVICLHNTLSGVHVTHGPAARFIWAVIHDPSYFNWDGYSMFTGYSILPWVGVMAVGYCLGILFQPGYDAAKRRRMLRNIGMTAIAAFFILRTINVYGDPNPWKQGASATATVMIFFNVAKYPASLLYLLITLGPVLLAMSLIDRSAISSSHPFVVIGRVPFFYYVIHLYIIHLVAVAVALSTGHPFSDMVSDTFITDSVKLRGTYGLSLGWVYLIWILVVLGLYPFCKRYAAYKQRNKDKWWLSYL